MFAKRLGHFLAVVVMGLPAPAGAKIIHVDIVKTVQADRGWQKTRLALHGRGILRFDARGRWIFNPAQPPVDGDGAAALSTAGRTNYTFSGREGREGQLIGKIGRGSPFIAGAQGVHKVESGETGSLYLIINDDIKHNVGSGLADNSGHLTVRIEDEWQRAARQYRSPRHHVH